MKKAILITLAVLSAAHARDARAQAFISVPQRSVADYIFTVPILTNDIQGVVMNPAEPYGVIRSEDVDWFTEAFAERTALQLGFIGNRPAGVGAQIRQVSFAPLWNGPTRNSDSGWLDPDVTLLSGVRLYDVNRLSDGVTVTNIYQETAYTNAVTNAFSTIKMPMTNGTVSVHTNTWTTYRLRLVSILT